MTLSDANVLLHAFRDDSEFHAEARGWLLRTLHCPAAFAISPQVLSGVIRISTHPRVYRNPSSVDQALAFAQSLLMHPRAVIVTPGEKHWTIFESLCRDCSATGNLVPDAWFAALAIEWSCEFVTYDRGYARFPGLRWCIPD